MKTSRKIQPKPKVTPPKLVLMEIGQEILDHPYSGKWTQDPLCNMAMRALIRGHSRYEVLSRKYPTEQDRLLLPSTHASLVDALEAAVASQNAEQVAELSLQYMDRMEKYCTQWDTILSKEVRRR